ncbi:MAG TPA: hypothetical protein VGO11_13740 [Chthoniobacteraceae bacterium]|jgi:hypothetical protein|nr:hypothetical protein [Chthoniobacteraceae bacterium]
MIQRLLLHPGDQPLFSVAVHGRGAPVALRVNDVPVFQEAGAASFHVTLPINEWLFQGVNELRLETAAGPGAAPGAEARLSYRQLRQPLKNAVPLDTLQCEPTGEPAGGESRGAAFTTEAGPPPIVQPGEPAEFEVRRLPARGGPGGPRSVAASFTLPRPWPVCPWAEGALLTEQINLKYSLRQFLQELWGCLARRDLAAIMKVAAVRASSLETAYHLNAHEVEEALLFPRLLQSPDWQMAPFRDEEWRLETAGHGRLARLVEEASGESPLRLVNQNEKLEAVVDAWWAFTYRWLLMR